MGVFNFWIYAKKIECVHVGLDNSWNSDVVQSAICNCQQEAYRLQVDIVMRLGDIFGYRSSKTGRIWTKLDRGMGNGGREILWNLWQDCFRSPRQRGKIPSFSVMNTTHPFGHVRFTDFRETWQEYVKTPLFRQNPLKKTTENPQQFVVPVIVEDFFKYPVISWQIFR